MVNIIIFGAPGSGKGTQGKKIADKYGFEHVSTGDILRKEIREKTELGSLAQEYINNGQLVPDQHVVSMLENVVKQKHHDVDGFIFDGFPRTIPQADALKEMLKNYGYEITATINLNVPEEELLQRLLERGKVSGRSDDNEETISKRLVEYGKKTQPLIDYFKEDGTLVHVEGVGEVDEIFKSVTSVIDERKRKLGH